MDDPQGLLALPPGFRYAVVTRAGETRLTSGEPTPSNHDGTAVFKAKRNRLRLIQNHELGAGSALGVPHVEGTVYDAGAVGGGGCTVIETDNAGNNYGEWVGISGTLTNCAGGPTPWGTWLTCEETETKKGGALLQDHGYVFEVFTDGTSNPKPIKAFGRYAHEALAIDDEQKHVYLSEDASGPNGLFYRWTAPAGFRARRGSRRPAGRHGRHARGDGDHHGRRLGAARRGVPDLRPARPAVPGAMGRRCRERDGQTMSVRKQFQWARTRRFPVTRGKKFEGVWGTRDGVYVVNSFAFNSADLPADAAKHDGMVWFYSYADETITLVTYFPHQPSAEDNDPAPRYSDLTFDGPDNVTVTPWGSLVLAEDGVGASHVLSSVPGGPTYAIARNMLNDSEFTGPAFSEDGRTLFVNIQTPGITLAITGPWETYLG